MGWIRGAWGTRSYPRVSPDSRFLYKVYQYFSYPPHLRTHFRSSCFLHSCRQAKCPSWEPAVTLHGPHVSSNSCPNRTCRFRLASTSKANMLVAIRYVLHSTLDCLNISFTMNEPPIKSIANYESKTNRKSGCVFN